MKHFKLLVFYYNSQDISYISVVDINVQIRL